MDNMKAIVKQLHAEANIQRMKVSITSKALIQYCLDHENTDALVRGFTKTPNPYAKEKSCTIIWKPMTYNSFIDNQLYRFELIHLLCVELLAMQSKC